QRGGAADARLIPRHDCELVAQVGELRRPTAAVRGPAVRKDQERSVTDLLICDTGPSRLDKVHHYKLLKLSRMGTRVRARFARSRDVYDALLWRNPVEFRFNV